jgi:hypothetical protein
VTVTVVPALTLRLYQLVCPTTRKPEAVVPTETSVWFPVADTVTVLPDKPVYDTEPELVPANSAVVDACFDPDNVDVEQLFNNFIPEGDTDPVYDTSANVSSLIQPKNELVPVRFRLRSVLNVLKADYSTKPTVVPIAVVFRSIVNAISYQYKLSPNTGQFNLLGETANLYRAIAAEVGIFAFDYSLSQAELVLNPAIGPFTWDAGDYRLAFGAEDLLLAQFDTDFSDSSGYDVLIAPLNTSLAPPVISNEVFKFGGGSLDNQPDKALFNQHVGAQWYLNPDKAPGLDEDFLFESWVYFNTLGFSCIWATDSSVETVRVDQTFALVTDFSNFVSGHTFMLYVVQGSSFNPRLIEHQTIITTGVWYHVALQRRFGQCVLFVNGVPAQNSAPAKFSLRNRHMLGNFNRTIAETGFRPVYGFFDGVRVILGAPRDTQGFTVPTQAPSTLDFATSTFNWTRKYSVEGTSYSLSAEAIDLISLTALISLETGDFTLQGFDAQFARPSRSIVAETGAYLLDRFDIIISPNIIAGASYFGWTNFATNIIYPSGIQLGDLAILAIETDSNGTTPLIPPAWQKFADTPVNTNTGALGTRLMLYWKRVTSVPEPTVNLGPVGDHGFAQITVWRNVKPTGNPFGAHTQGFSTVQQSTHTAAGITTAIGSSTVLVFSTSAADTFLPWGNTPINPNLKNSNWQRNGTSSGNGGGISLFSGSVTAPRDIGNTTVFLSSSFPDQFTFYTVELLANSPAVTAQVEVPAPVVIVNALAPVRIGGGPKEVVVPHVAFNVQANPVTIFSSMAVGVPLAELAVTGQTPSVSTGVLLTPPSATVEITGLPPLILERVDSDIDPDFASVSLLLHMDGSNGSTTFTDSSLNAFTVTRSGGAVISTAEFKFGGASARFNANTDYLTAANNSAFDIVNGNPFTVECWVFSRVALSTRVQYVLRHQHTSGFANGGWVVGISGANNTFFFSFGTGSAEVNLALVSGASTYSQNTWHHVAATYDGTTYRVFMDGVLVRSSVSAATGVAANSSLFIARDPSNTATRWWDGYIDELRITKGVARYTSAFTPPTAPFPEA